MISKRLIQIQRYVLQIGSSRYLPSSAALKAPRDIYDEIRRMGITQKEWTDLTFEEAVSLGFQAWSEEQDLMLIPQWLIPAIPDGLEMTLISGSTFIFSHEGADFETRMGMLAYGLNFKKGHEIEATEIESVPTSDPLH